MVAVSTTVMIGTTVILSYRSGAENGLQDVPIPHGTGNKKDKLNLQASPREYTSNNINKLSRQEAAAQTGILLYKLVFKS